MSTTDGDASSRLDQALTEVFSKAPTLPPRDAGSAASPSADADADWSVDDDQDVDDGAAGADTPFELPEIVPATSDPAPPPPPSPAPSLVAPPTTSAPTPAASASAPATSWADHMTSVPANASGPGLRAPGRRPRVRRVTRVLRHIDPWSTFKVALLFSVVAYLVSLTSGVLLWRVADSTGTLDNVERWFTQFGWETFELQGGEIFHNAWIIGLFGAVALTGALVLLATLFNLVSDIVGGVRLTVLEEEVVERTVSSTRRYVVRRPPTAADGTTAADDWDVDDDSTKDPDTAPSSSPSSSRDASSSPSSPEASPADWSVDDDDETERSG